MQRIVVTSSCASVFTSLPQPTVFSEHDWNESVIEEVRRLGNKTSPVAIYDASKTLAEKGGFLNILLSDLLFMCLVISCLGFLRSAQIPG